MVDLSIITVSFNSGQFIEKYLKSVLKFSDKKTEVIILDSGSSDDTVSVIKNFLKNSPKRDAVRLIEEKENVGFGKGNNLAVKEAKGNYLFFLNPDTELEGSLKEMIEFYEQTENVGLVAPKLITKEGNVQPTVKKLPSVWGAFKEYVLGVKHSYSEYAPESGVPVGVEAVYGAAILVSKDIFEKVGGFNEKFFLYYEDMDFCRKIKKLGREIFYYPKVEIMHLVGAAKSTEDRYVLNQQAAKTYHGKWGAFFLSLIFLVPRLRRRLGVS